MPLANVIIFGLGDALNPCNLSNVIIFAALLGWLRRGKVSTVYLGWVFIGMSYVASLIYAAGGLMNVLYSIAFFNIGRVIYVVLGVVFVVVGILHLMDWVKIQKSANAYMMLPLLDDGQGKPVSQFLAKSSILAGAFVLNAIATIWPGNKFIMFYANYLYVPGEFNKTMIMLVVYCVMLVLPIAAGLLWISLTSPGGWVSKNISRAKIMTAAVILGLGVSLIYIFR